MTSIKASDRYKRPQSTWIHTSDSHSGPVTDAYKAGWERTFRKRQPRKVDNRKRT